MKSKITKPKFDVHIAVYSNGYAVQLMKGKDILADSVFEGTDAAERFKKWQTEIITKEKAK